MSIRLYGRSWYIDKRAMMQMILQKQHNRAYEKKMFTRVKGTQDFLDLVLFNFLIDQAKKHLKNYNFHEIATPIIEHAELFLRSLGSETDVVTKEMYLLKGDDENPLLFASRSYRFVRACIC